MRPPLFILKCPIRLTLWIGAILSNSLVAQEVAFDATFDASTTVNPTDVANLNAGTAVGTWSDLPASAESVGIFDSGGDKGFLVDRASAA